MQTNNKLREALEALLNLAYEVEDMNSDSGPRTSMPTKFVIDTAKAALAEPVQNCEVGTAMEQGERFSAYCRAHKHPESECLPCPLFGQTGGHCELAWAQMPYVEQEGGRYGK